MAPSSKQPTAKCVKCGGGPLASKVLCATCCRRTSAKYRKLRRERAAQGLCPSCGAKLGPGARCAKCVAKRRKWDKALRQRRLNSGVCVFCGKGPLATQRYCATCSTKKAAHGRASALRRKAQVIAHYGGACVCCGETILQFLTIDHIDGGGNKERKCLGSNPGGSAIIRRIVRQGYPDGLQVLCWNCNCGRALNGGICPHQQNKNGS